MYSRVLRWWACTPFGRINIYGGEPTEPFLYHQFSHFSIERYRVAQRGKIIDTYTIYLHTTAFVCNYKPQPVGASRSVGAGVVKCAVRLSDLHVFLQQLFEKPGNSRL